MYEKILIPLDGSERAESIMSHATELAKQFDSQLILLQVIEPVLATTMAYEGTISPVIYEEELSRLQTTAEEYMASWHAKLANRQIKTKTVIEHGAVVHNILDVAEREGADLIAMSSHGRTGLSRVFYGSIAAGVLHSASLPLLLIRAETGT